jgi:hypothetical protein
MVARDMKQLACLVCATLIAGCGSSPVQPAVSTESSPEFASDALLSLSSDSGGLRIEVRTSPEQPPSRGLASVELVIRDAATNAPRSGLSLSVLPWMPAHGHGASLQPTVAETAPGTYVISGVDFFMPGSWELRTTLSGSIADHVEPSFEIP